MNDLDMPTTQHVNVEDNHGRTGWDLAAHALQSKILWIFLFSCLGAVLVWLFWAQLSIVPLYAISSVFLSLFWYNPISRWLSRQSTFIECWDMESNTLTTWRVGRDAFAQLNRKGITNVIQSLTGNNRIFATVFNPDEGILETSWVHDLDSWSYHVERRTFNRLTSRVIEVLDDVTIGEAMAQVEGRIHARASMQRHYSDLDKIFFGDVEKELPVQPIPGEV